MGGLDWFEDLARWFREDVLPAWHITHLENEGDDFEKRDLTTPGNGAAQFWDFDTVSALCMVILIIPLSLLYIRVRYQGRVRFTNLKTFRILPVLLFFTMAASYPLLFGDDVAATPGSYTVHGRQCSPRFWFQPALIFIHCLYATGLLGNAMCEDERQKRSVGGDAEGGYADAQVQVWVQDLKV